MKCDKCQQEFEELELQLSHDIPKYMGGSDLDGRHWLCFKCHQKYEWDILKITFMNLIKSFPEKDKANFRFYAQIVKSYFFKNDTKTTDESRI